jgi:hypothetical protein
MRYNPIVGGPTNQIYLYVILYMFIDTQTHGCRLRFCSGDIASSDTGLSITYLRDSDWAQNAEYGSKIGSIVARRRKHTTIWRYTSSMSRCVVLPLRQDHDWMMFGWAPKTYEQSHFKRGRGVSKLASWYFQWKVAPLTVNWLKSPNNYRHIYITIVNLARSFN